MFECYQKAYEKIQQVSAADLNAVRQQPFADFLIQGFPKRRDENWKYTDISVLENANFNLALDKTVANLKIDKYCLPNSHHLVFINGHFVPQMSNMQSLPAGVILTNMVDAWQRFPQLVKPYLQTENKTSFDNLNAALMTDGLFLYVPKNVMMPQPVQLLCLATQGLSAAMQHLRNVIIVESDSQLIYLEDYIGLASVKYFNNVVTQIALNARAQMAFYKCQNEARSAYHVANIQVEQKTNTQFKSYSFSLGGQIARDDLAIMMNGTGANCDLNGLYLVQDKQHVDQHTRIDHVAAHCTSRENYKGILDGKATGVFNGKVFIHPHAQQSKAKQSNQNLLLSKNAEMNTKPELEIYADDVQCAHGATVGQIDEMALFYLRSRGIDETTARHILIHAFMSEIVDDITPPAIKLHIDNFLRGKL